MGWNQETEKTPLFAFDMVLVAGYTRNKTIFNLPQSFEIVESIFAAFLQFSHGILHKSI